MRCVSYHKFALARQYPPRAVVRGAGRLPGRTILPMPPVGFWEAFRFWLRLGFINFGGPTGQIAIMHHELVERRRWISNERFLHALSYCMLLPGPEAQQLATYIGWLLHRTAGGLVAGTLFVLPGFASILALSFLYAAWGDLPLVHGAQVALAALSFAAIFCFEVPFPWIVLAAGLVGLAGSKLAPGAFRGPRPQAPPGARGGVG